MFNTKRNLSFSYISYHLDLSLHNSPQASDNSSNFTFIAIGNTRGLLQSAQTKATPTQDPDPTSSLTFPTMTPPNPSRSCTIYYNCPNRANSTSPKIEEIAQIRHVEFHLHLQKDTRQGTVTGKHPAKTEFEACPIWNFLRDSPNGDPHPTVDIILTSDGAGKIPRDYSATFEPLLDLMQQFQSYSFEQVLVKLEGGGSFGDSAARRVLREAFESEMGKATVLDGREGRRMRFDPSSFQLEEQRDENFEFYNYMD